MSATTFRLFGFDHAVVLALAAAAALVLLIGVPGIRRIRDDRPIRLTVAAVLALAGGAAWIRDYREGLKLVPFHLCDVALVAVLWALLRPNQRLASELAFYWGLAGSAQAILTPELAEGFPSVRWLSFFLLHSGVMLGAIYLIVRGPLVVRLGSIGRAWLATNVYAAAAGLLNWRLGTNFGFLARKPLTPSILDYLGPWPYYIVVCEGIALVLFFACYGLARWVEGRAQP